MPELPEVETMRMQLEKFLVGSTITKVDVSDKRLLTGEIKDIVGGKVTGVRRFAKVTSIDLSNGFSILTHVKLTGQFIYKGPKHKTTQAISKKVVGGAPGPHSILFLNLVMVESYITTILENLAGLELSKQMMLKKKSL